MIVGMYWGLGFDNGRPPVWGCGEMPAIHQHRPILVIEDDENDLIQFRRLLTDARIARRVVAVENGAKACAYLQRLERTPGMSAPPCVIFADIAVPDMDGFEFLEWVRRHETWSGLPVVMLSGSERAEDRLRAELLGADGYVKKFPDVQTTENVVAQWLD